MAKKIRTDKRTAMFFQSRRGELCNCFLFQICMEPYNCELAFAQGSFCKASQAFKKKKKKKTKKNKHTKPWFFVVRSS